MFFEVSDDYMVRMASDAGISAQKQRVVKTKTFQTYSITK